MTSAVPSLLDQILGDIKNSPEYLAEAKALRASEARLARIRPALTQPGRSS